LKQVFSAKVSARKKLDPVNVVKVWRLNAEELASIRIIARQARHPYDFGLAGDSKTQTSLEEFMQSREEAFPFAQDDLLDKWKVNSMNAEAFKHYIDREKLTVPGTLSAATTAKLIVYCLLIMEAEHQALQAAGFQALQLSRPNAQDVVNSLAARASGIDPKKEGSELDHSFQFAEAVRNPLVRAGVNNAAVNRWGLPKKNRVNQEKALAEKPLSTPSSWRRWD
jgi:hypothetical protein